MEKKCKKAKWLSGEALQIAVKRREAKSKGYNPAIPMLGIHTEETRIERDTCTPMFIAALFTIARTWFIEFFDTYLKKEKEKPDLQSNDVMTFTEYAPDAE